MTMERTKISVRTAAPLTREVYANLNYVLLMKSQADPNDSPTLEKLSISAVLSAIVSVFNWDALDLRYITQVPTPNNIQVPEANADTINTVLYLAMGSLMNCVKPVTVENAPYVDSRWSALTATFESAGRAVPKVTVDPTFLIRVASECRPYVVPESVVKFLIRGDNDQAEFYNQVSMVYSFAGMKLVEEMKVFSMKPYNCAILLTSVMDQARDYINKYTAIKNAHPQHFEYARITPKSEIEPLDAAKFPDLYWATYYSMKEKVSKNFRTSSHTPSTPKSVIKRFASESLTDYGSLSDENKRVLEALGVNWDLAKSRANQLLKKVRKTYSDSETDSEDEEPSRPKRRRIN